VVAQAAAPGVHFAGLDAEGDVSRAGGAMSGKKSPEERDFGAKEKQDGRPGADLKRRAASSLEVGVVDEAQAEDVAIEGSGAVEICDVEGAFENGVRREGHRAMVFPGAARFNGSALPGRKRVWTVNREVRQNACREERA